jgi:pyridoxal phosphate enzyme (YggS family)
MSRSELIRKNYTSVMERIARSANAVGRTPDDVCLLVVTKGQTLETVQAAVGAGARFLGENYAEQAIPKIEAMSGSEIEWHMIGHVQSRKANMIVQYFDYLHSLDSIKLANRLNRFALEAGRVLPVLLECNLSSEESKFGWPAWNEVRWPELADDLSPLFDLLALEVRGLMTMPPYDPDPEKSRPYFRKLHRLRDFLSGRIPQAIWSELSMGMSGDFEVAIEEGATFVRVGTAIVGPRE